MKISQRVFATLLTFILCFSMMCVSARAAGELMHGIGFVNATSLRVRKEPSTTSAVVDVALNKECVAVISKSGDWYKVNYNLQIGYMHKDYLNVLTCENAELGYGKVTGSSVNLRSGPATTYSKIATAAKNDKCYIIGLNQGWYKVIYESRIGYIRSDYLELTEIPYENHDSSNAPKFYRQGKSTGLLPSASALNGTSSENKDEAPSISSPAPNITGQQILSKAQQYLGTPYVYGGATPAGFDCSGFVYYVLKSFGFSPYRTPADQYRQGTFVEKNNLQVGDIVFFANTYANGISHVGIYAGNGRFIHSPNSRSVVSYADLTSGYWAQHYYGARRMA